MILISQEESKLLQEAGFKFGNEIFHTIGKGKKKTYYAVESKNVIEKIRDMRRV